MGRCTAACMLGGSPWKLILKDNEESIDLRDAWIFTILWGEWHPTTELSDIVTLDERKHHEIYLAPAFPDRQLQMVLNKEVSLAVAGSESALSKRLYFRQMPEGVSNDVLAIEGLRQGIGFTKNLVDRYVKFPQSLSNPPLEVPETRYFGIYVFLADENQKGDPDPATLVPNSTNFLTQNIKSGWLFFMPNDEFPLKKYLDEPFGINPDGTFDYNVPPAGLPKVPFDIPIPPKESFVILNTGDPHYGALTGPNREVYFVNQGTNPDLELQVRNDFNLPETALRSATKIRVEKEGRDALIQIDVT